MFPEAAFVAVAAAASAVVAATAVEETTCDCVFPSQARLVVVQALVLTRRAFVREKAKE